MREAGGEVGGATGGGRTRRGWGRLGRSEEAGGTRGEWRSWGVLEEECGNWEGLGRTGHRLLRGSGVGGLRAGV